MSKTENKRLTKSREPEITGAKISDMAEILTLQQAAFQSEALIHGDFTIQPLTQTLDEIIAEYNQSMVLKAVEDGEIVGSVRAHVEGDTVHIAKLIVHPEHQGKGLGRQLLAAIEEKFPQKRYELYTACKSDRNLHLYETAGYTPFRRETDHAGIAFVHLEKLKTETARAAQIS
ncbi:MAG: GNAT family N-acetyltransferase [Tannerella sp.]|jgi:ribosomal protein S18 acetylase RimI-like enzyme|nr:GNAT family N-acetyltransferase [Tannerella sp.]